MKHPKPATTPYPLLTKHNVRLVNVCPHSPTGVDFDDFERAMKERGLWEWYQSEPRRDTCASNGMYASDAERYLNRRPTND